MQFFSKYLIWLTVVLFWLASCDNTTNPQYKSKATNLLTGTNNTFKKLEQVNTFLNLYVPTDSFPITLSTKVGEWEGPESNNFKWRGTAIPPTFWPVFYALVSYNPLAEEPSFFATKRFLINNYTLALLTRVPGEYWSSQVYLFLFDTQTYKIIKSLRVAEAWADAGDSFYLETTIDKVGENGFRIILKQNECHPLDENYEKFTCADSLKTFSLQNRDLRFISATALRK